MYYLSKGNSHNSNLSHQWSYANNALPRPALGTRQEPGASGPIFIQWDIQTQQFP